MGDDKYRVMDCPYTGKRILTVPAANPDVCIVHVQRADKYGNAQYWGAMGSVANSALASKRIIVSCEEIVDHEIIKSSPHNTIIPSYRVDAVVEVPWGAHPTEVLGYYNLDRAAMGLFFLLDMKAEGLKSWMDEWIYGCRNRKEYMERLISKHGIERVESLKAKPYYSSPVNYGSAFNTCWDNEGRERSIGLKLDELENVMEQRGLLYE